MDDERDPLELAVRALQHRALSVRELDDRLAHAGVGDEDRAATLVTLGRLGYVDDARFASARADSLARRGYGDAAIRADLERRGIAGDEAEAALAALEPERERASALTARDGATARTARRLAAKGFSADAIEAALGGNVATGRGEAV
jgi:regulatory protein